MGNILKIFKMSRNLYRGNIRYLIAFVLLITVISILIALIDPIILRIIFDALESGESSKVFAVCLQAGIIIAVFFALCYIQNCYCDIWLYRLIGNGNSTSFLKYHALPYGEKKSQYEEGDSFNRVNAGVESLAYVWLFLSLIISNIICSILVSALALTTSLWIILLAIILFLFTMIRARYESKKNTAFSTEEQELGGTREGYIHSLIHNMEFLAMTDTVDILKNRYDDVREKIWNVDKKRVYLSVWLDALEEVIKGGLRGLLAFLIFPLKNLSLISTGQVVSSFSIYDSLYNNLCQLRRPIAALPRQLVPVQRLTEILELRREKKDKSHKADKNLVVDMKNISFQMDGKEILKDVSLEVQRGQKVAVVGQNGCGKSTLMRMILGLYVPEAGYCSIMGESSAHSTYGSRRMLTSFIPSRNQLFSQTSRWNIESGAEDEEMNSVESMAKKLMIEQSIDGFLDKNTEALSGGQAKRVNIARGLIHRAPVILADEPSASLDPRLGELVIKELVSGSETVMLITHHPQHIKYFDRIIIMDDGKIAEDIGVDELANNNCYNKWLGTL